MSEVRSKRTVKAPKKYGEDNEDGENGQAFRSKLVLRYLTRKDVTRELIGKEVCTLWPDNGVWYTGIVEELQAKALKAKVSYTVTDEVEQLQLAELISTRQIAFKSEHSASYVLRAKEEVLLDPAKLDVPVGEAAEEAALQLSDDTSDGSSDGEAVRKPAAATQAAAPEAQEEQAQTTSPEKATEAAEEVTEAAEEAAEAAEEEPQQQDEDLPDGDPAPIRKSSRKRSESIVRRSISPPAKRQRSSSLATGSAEGKLSQQLPAASQQQVLSQRHVPKRARSPSAASSSDEDADESADLLDAEQPSMAVQRSRRQITPSQKALEASGELQLPLKMEAALKSHTPPVQSPKKEASPLGPGQPSTAKPQEAAAKAEAAPAAGKPQGDQEFTKAENYSRDFLANILKARGKAGSGSLSQASFYGNSDRKPSPTPAQILAPRSSLGVSDASEGSGSTHAPGRVPSSLRVTSGSFPLASDDAVRAKTRENFAAALQKAVEELQSEGAEEAAIGDPVRVAHEVEVALYKLFGNSGKEYRTKFRTLSFNLTDAANPHLRARVLRRELPPDTFVRLSPNELASRELSQWRNQKAEEAMRATVLDEATAARFSTAAALDAGKRRALGIDWRDSTLDNRELTPEKEAAKRLEEKSSLPAPTARPPRPPEQPSAQQLQEPEPNLEETMPEARNAPADGQPADFTKPEVSEEKPAEAAGPAEAKQEAREAKTSIGSFDWASIKADAERAAAQQQQAAAEPFIPFDFLNNDDGGGYNPEDPLVDGEALAEEGEPPTGGDESGAGDLSGVLTVLPAAHEKDIGRQVWEGTVDFSGSGVARLSATCAAGVSQLQQLLPNEMDIKGRVRNASLDKFVGDLQNSRSRALTTAVLRSVDAESAQVLSEMGDAYRSHDRTGVAEPGSHVEAYFVAQGQLSLRLLAASRVATREAGLEHLLDAIPKQVEAGEMLLVMIHRKDWQPKPQAQLPSPVHADFAPEAASVPAGEASRATPNEAADLPATQAASAFAQKSPGKDPRGSSLPSDPRQHTLSSPNPRADPTQPQAAPGPPPPPPLGDPRASPAHTLASPTQTLASPTQTLASPRPTASNALRDPRGVPRDPRAAARDPRGNAAAPQQPHDLTDLLSQLLPAPSHPPEAPQQPPGGSQPPPGDLNILPPDIDFNVLSNLASSLGISSVNVAPDASQQKREQAVASAVVAEAVQQAPAAGGSFQEDADAAAANFLNRLLGPMARAPSPALPNPPPRPPPGGPHQAQGFPQEQGSQPLPGPPTPVQQPQQQQSFLSGQSTPAHVQQQQFPQFSQNPQGYSQPPSVSQPVPGLSHQSQLPPPPGPPPRPSHMTQPVVNQHQLTQQTQQYLPAMSQQQVPHMSQQVPQMSQQQPPPPPRPPPRGPQQQQFLNVGMQGGVPGPPGAYQGGFAGQPFPGPPPVGQLPAPRPHVGVPTGPLPPPRAPSRPPIAAGPPRGAPRPPQFDASKAAAGRARPRVMKP